MKLRLLLQLPSLAAIIVCLHSCESDGLSAEEQSSNDSLIATFELGGRYDLGELERNPGDTAVMPGNLIDEDLLTYTPTSEDLTTNNVSIPKSRGQDDWVLRPESSGTVLIETFRYKYGEDDELGKATISGGGGFPGVGLEEIIEAGIERNGSWASVRPNPSFLQSDSVTLTAEQREVLREAINSLGSMAVDIPDAKAAPVATIGRLDDTQQIISSGPEGGSRFIELLEKWLGIDRLVVLSNRKITHTVTSSNGDILESGEIRGTFELVDSYTNLYLYQQAGETSGWIITTSDSAKTDGGGKIAGLQPQEIKPKASGTFVLKLGDLGTVNPNPGFSQDTSLDTAN